VLEKVPFFILGIAVAIVTYSTHLSRGALAGQEIIPFGQRSLVAVRGYIFYLKKTVLPLDLAPFYPYPENATLMSPEFTLSVILFSAITVYTVLSLKKYRFIAAAWFYYLVTLFPVIGIIKTGDFATPNRYTYLPGLGPSLLVGLLSTGSRTFPPCRTFCGVLL
jgi:hypothetical protein